MPSTLLLNPLTPVHAVVVLRSTCTYDANAVISTFGLVSQVATWNLHTFWICTAVPTVAAYMHVALMRRPR